MAKLSLFQRIRMVVFWHLIVAGSLAVISLPSHAQISLADQPLFTSTAVPGNLLLSLSVEYPTALSWSYASSTNPYTPTNNYLGYFDPGKCYNYQYNTTTPASSYFQSYNTASSHACASTSTTPLWSGNWLNWAAMQTIDSFRWALTGGYRSVDTTSTSILERAWASGQGGNSETPNKSIPASGRPASDVTGATPFNGTWTVTSRAWGAGNQIWVSGISSSSLDSTSASGTTNYIGQSSYNNTVVYSGTPVQTCNATRTSKTKNGTTTYGAWSTSSCTTATTNQYDSTPYLTAQSQSCTASSGNSLTGTCITISATNSTMPMLANSSTVYALNVRVKVCDTTVSLESNCTQYGSGYKPEGLMQQYAMQIRFGAFGYLDDPAITRDGGVLRANMKYVGPMQPVPGAASIVNTNAEWSSTDGTFVTNPNPSDATATGVSNSGVINYLNKFGEAAQTYKTYDPVSELYYAGIRYYKNLGNVSTYTSGPPTTTMLDGFPVITTWADPIIYACQKNFILGIGDVNTHADANLPGSTIGNPSYETSTRPTDTTVNVQTATNMVGKLEGISNLGTTLIGDSATNFIAGLAYDSHVKDIRPNDFQNTDGTKNQIQTISTYWLDVQEYQAYVNNNQYYLATKYGGFVVPTNFQPYASTNALNTLTVGTGTGTTTPLTTAMWHTNSDTFGSNSRPDNYFDGGQADKMIAGLQSAFANISSQITASTTTFSTTSAQLTAANNLSYATQYSAGNWTGDVIASLVSYDASGNTTFSQVWDVQPLLQTQTSRNIITCCTITNVGLPFEVSNLSTGSLNSRTNYASFAGVPGVASGSQSAANFLAYLRGNQSLETSQVGGVYRTRTFLLGDIVDSKVSPVGPPNNLFSDNFNPGYGSFKSTYAARKTVVYVGANDGMMHAFDGSQAGGSELFAYIPSFTYGTSTTAAVSGLASLGNPNFVHHFLVDGTPQAFDIDMNHTSGSSTTTPAWKSVLIGGLGKGGNGYYAIDVTDPTTWTSETTLAGKVMWEFTDTTGRMGYSYGDPTVVKTKKYGWVAIFTSGYNNVDGVGYFFIVNPQTGTLLEAVSTGVGSTTNQAGLAYASAYVPDYTDGTADSVYAGDLLGNMWRLDLTPTSGLYAAPTKIATLTDPSGNPQPVTTRPLIEVQPSTFKRYVLIGTGRLLSTQDINSTQIQTFYAIIDGTSGAFYTSATLPSAVTFPVGRNNLVANTNLLTGIGTAPSNPMGWYYDLGTASNGVAERIDATPNSTSGLVAFAANLPNGVVCAPSGTSQIFGLNFGTGTSVLTDNNGNLIKYTSLSSVVTDVQFYNVNGTIRLQIGDSQGSVVNPPGTFGSSSTLKRLNWRELPTAD